MMNPIQQTVLAVHGHGYNRGTEIIAAGPGVRQSDLNEVALWFAEHDPSEKIRISQPSLFFHPLPSGNYTIGRMLPLEKSNPKLPQPSFLVQHWFVDPGTLAEFANNPISLYRQVLREHALDSFADFNGRSLESIIAEMPYPRPPVVDFSLLDELIAHPGPKMVALLLQSMLDSVCTFFIGGGPGQRILEGLFNLLPVAWRTELSFSSDLIFTSLRPFRAIGIPVNNARTVREFEESGFSVCNLSSEHRTAQPSIGELDPWSRLIYYVLQKRQLSFFADHIAEENAGKTALHHLEDTKELHQSGIKWLREALEKGIISDLPEPFVPTESDRDMETVSFPLPWVKQQESSGDSCQISLSSLAPAGKFVPALFRPSVKMPESPVQEPEKPKKPEMLTKSEMSLKSAKSDIFANLEESELQVAAYPLVFAEKGLKGPITARKRPILKPELEETFETLDSLTTRALFGDCSVLPQMAECWGTIRESLPPNERLAVSADYLRLVETVLAHPNEQRSSRNFSRSLNALDLFEIFLKE